MKQHCPLLAAAILVAMSGCATAPVAVQAPVGPNPAIRASGDRAGQLSVYTAREQMHNDSQFQTAYYQETAYAIYDSGGRKIRNVNNNNSSEFFAVPRTIELPPGRYQIHAWMASGLGERVIVPVVVESGRKTEVHLDGKWPQSADTDGRVVMGPGGFSIGWRADAGNL